MDNKRKQKAVKERLTFKMENRAPSMGSLMMKMIHRALCISAYGGVTKGRKLKNGPSVTFATNSVVPNAPQEELTFLVTSTAITAVFEGNLA